MNLIKQTIKDNQHQLTHSVKVSMPTKYGEFNLYFYKDIHNNQEHLALVMGSLSQENLLPMVRIHSACLTGDVFGSKRCDCGNQIDQALKIISKNRSGIFVYLDQEGRGIGLGAKLRAYVLQDQGLDTVEANIQLGYKADERDFSIAAHILNDLKVKDIILLTNNPQKIKALENHGISVVRQPHWIKKNSINAHYLETKKEKLGHLK